MIRRSHIFALLIALQLSVPGISLATDATPRKVLIVVEGSSSLKNFAMGDGRQLAALMGHFNTVTTVLGVSEYTAHAMKEYDYVFYIGFHAANPVPARFLDDVLASSIPVIWLNTGFREFSARPEVGARYGFVVSRFDSTGEFTAVKSGERVFGKGEPNLNLVRILDKKKALVVATALSPKYKRDSPYIVRSGNLLYIADSPFASTGEADRYLLFADMLHDILREPHEESHTAIIRIEDVNPMENPEKLRDVADILSARGIPFLVGVIPFYVNPGEGIRVSLSDKPELVDALRYMVQNGGTIIMHGVTHQYRGITASDYEFWDDNTGKPIKEETVEGISRKLDMGIQEFMKNGLAPLAWETPHYTASFRLYQTIGKYFSTAIEQRLSIEDFDYSQYFPYIIYRDLFGQRIYPENLGYVPLDPDLEKSRGYVRTIIANAKANLAVRDGFASCFFHAFLDLDLLKELVDGVQALGYTYMDLREQSNWVRTKDRIIVSGDDHFTLTLADQYLQETTFGRNGDIANNTISEKRIRGQVTRDIHLEPGQFYRAEPVEFREQKGTIVGNIVLGAEKFFRRTFTGDEPWREARPAIMWNYHARGGAFNDQASLAAVMRSVNIDLDTIFAGQRLDLTPYNLLIMPFTMVDSLSDEDFDAVTHFVEAGGNLITDAKNDLVENFGITFSDTRLKVNKVRDRYFPEEHIRWKNTELVNKFDTQDVEEVFCVDEATEAPMAIGKKWGKGKLIFFGTRFDPYSQLGTSMYPYLLEYIRKYFRLGPVVRRDNLEVFFEPGSRRNISIEQMIRQWVKQGIRIIHVAGWHEYPKYTYDYERLIRLAHANGILVYAWLEPPQVSQKFWLEHPEWREKNIRGEDVRPSWRYPVALTDDKCLQSMASEYHKFLEANDWDGVNLAELYFEAGRGFQDPNLYTPLHPTARREIQRKYGVDVAGVLDPRSPFFWKINPSAASIVTEYRVQEITKAYEVFLPMLTAFSKQKEGFQVIVTAMDSFGSPELRDYIGVDMTRIIGLQRKYGFSLQVEDPENLWSSDPRRYLGIARRYTELLGSNAKLLLDLNILSFRKPEVITPYPTVIQTGTESFHLVRAASSGAPRITIYSESSVNPQDMMFFPYALASNVHYDFTPGGYTIHSPQSFTLKLPPERKEIRVDGIPLSPYRENFFLIPAGDHIVALESNAANTFATHSLETRLLSFTGNILTVAYGMRSVDFTYDADGRALLALNREPTFVSVDGGNYPVVVMKGNDCFSTFLPSGHHTVHIIAGDVFSYGVNLTSFWSSNVFALFGSLAVLSLVLMYLALKFVKRRPFAAGELP